MLKKSLRLLPLIAALFTVSLPAQAADYHVVVPAPGKAAPYAGIKLELSPASLPVGYVGEQLAGFDFNTALLITGDPELDMSQVAWSVYAGSLPVGLSLSQDGNLDGTPTQEGELSFQALAKYKTKTAVGTYQIAVSQEKHLVNKADGRYWADGTFAQSCLEYRQPVYPYVYAGATGDGVYRIQLEGSAVVSVYCDMAKDGGGWMLAVTQKGQPTTRFAARNTDLVTPAAAGSHEQMGKLFGISSEFRWTDMSNTRFLQGRTDMSIWFKKLTSQACDIPGSTIDVNFENGWFNTATAPRKVEACDSYVFGMRNSWDLSPFRDIPGYDTAWTHMCWFDDAYGDRPFSNSLDDVHPNRSFCTQFGYSFPLEANRGGTMDYMVWVR